MGAVRLANAGFRSMPRRTAVASLVLGGCVIAFGVALPFIQADEEPFTPAPRITLDPAAGDPPSVRDRVHGVVRTAGGRPASGVRVELTPLFDDEGAEQRSVSTDDDGRFVFAGVDVTPGTPYVADARFDGATFSSEVLRFGRGEDDPLRIVVAPTTKRADDVFLDVESIALVGDDKGLQAVHALTVRNRGDRAYVGGLRLPLLPGANAIDPRGGLDRRYLELDDSGLLSRAPIAPGRLDITYTYVASVPRSGLRFQHRAAYPTDRFEVLVGGDLEAARVEGLERGDEVRVGPRGSERTYRRYVSERLLPRDPVELVVSVKRSAPLLRIGGIVVAAVLALGIVAFPLVRRRRRDLPSPAPPQPVTAE
jgi:hypothetical protein